MVLRPTFTKKLAALLLAGQHINLISPHGQGRRRTLQDLKSLLPADLFIKQIDLKDLGLSEYQSLLSEAAKSLVMEKKSVLLILHNFNAMNHFSDVQQLLNTKHISLLTVSEKTGEEPHQDFNHIAIPAIHKRELMTEIKRRNMIEFHEVDKLADYLLQQPAPYTMLDERDKDWFASGLWKL